MTEAVPRPPDDNLTLSSEAILPLHGNWQRSTQHSGSPLRYPGSKRKMVPALQALIQANIPRPKLFVEPFVGGGSVSLRLLELDAVDQVILGDLDPLIASFWHVAAYDTEWLIKAVNNEPVTLERWDHWRAATPTGRRNQALKCIFLNRTSFNGVLQRRAGPIGGRAQTSEYKIDCRFNKEQLSLQLQNIGHLAKEGRILDVWHSPWRAAIERLYQTTTRFRSKEALLYLDPPYIEKSHRLYVLAFSEQDHAELADHLISQTRHRWILSYDEEPAVLDLYLGRPGVSAYRPIHHYTSRGSRNTQEPGREIVFTNLTDAPHPTEAQ